MPGEGVSPDLGEEVSKERRNAAGRSTTNEIQELKAGEIKKKYITGSRCKLYENREG